MKRLIIMRHAKSSWTSGASSDHGRPLNKRGARDAPRMGQALRDRGWLPELAISSDSQRTRETWAGVAGALDEDVEVQWTHDFYHGDAHDIAEAITALDEEISCVIVLGHNPGWEDAVRVFAGASTTFTTANCALLQADGDWETLGERGAWQLVELLRPKELDDE